MNLSEYGSIAKINPDYHTKFYNALGPQDNMRINGKPISIRITGISIIGVGALEWIAKTPDIHHIIISFKPLNLFEMNVLTGRDATVISEHIPPTQMADRIKNLLDG